MTATLTALVLAAGVLPPPQECTVSLRVTKVDPTAPRAGQWERAICEPRIVTHYSRPAIFRIGEVELPFDGPGVRGPGVIVSAAAPELEVIPLRLPDGTVRLEMQMRPTGTERGQKLVLVGQTGTKHRFRLETKTDGQIAVEVVVTEPESVGRK